MRDILDELAAKGVRTDFILRIAKAFEAQETLLARRDHDRQRLKRFKTFRNVSPKIAKEINRAETLANVSPPLLSSLLPSGVLLEEEQKEARSDVVALGGASEFATFYQQYPHKVGKRAAQKAFPAARKRASMPDIMAGLMRYIAKTDDRPWCNPATWLNQDRWADQPGPSQEGRGNGKGRRHGSVLDAADRLIDQLGGEEAARRYVPGSEGPRPLDLDNGNGPPNLRLIPKR